MSDLQKALKALEAADAAGDTEAAREIALAVKSMQGAQAPAPAANDKPWHSVITDPLRYGADQATENFAATANAVGATGVGQTLSDAVEAPKNYGKSYSEDFINSGKEGYNWSSLPGATLEQLPQMVGSLAARGVGAGVGGAVAGPAGVVAGGLLGPAAFEFVQVVGPVALKLAKERSPDGVPTADDWAQAAMTAGASGALNAIGIAKVPGLNKLLGTLARETVTETGQGLTEQAGSTLGTPGGLQLNAADAFGEGLIGGSSRAVTAAPGAGLRAAKKINADLKAPYEIEYEDGAIAAANRLKKNRDEMGFNDKDSNRNRYSNEAFNELAGTAHTQISEEIKGVFAQLRPELAALDDGTVEGIMKRAEANAGIRDGLNKRKGVVTKSQYATLESAIGGTDVGNKALALLRESNELTRLTNRETLGGLSGPLEFLNPLSGSGQEKATKALTGAIAGSATGGLSIAGQLALYGGARAIDKFTGRRYPYAKFINDYAGRETPELGGESLADIRARQEADIQAAVEAQRQARTAEREAARTARANTATTLRMRQQIERNKLRQEREARRAEAEAKQATNEAAKADNQAFRDNSEIIMRAMWEDPSVVSQEWMDTYGPQLTKADFRSAAIMKRRNEANAEKEAAKAEGAKKDKEAVKAEMEVQEEKPVSEKAVMAEIGRQAAAVMKVAKLRQKYEAEQAKKLAVPAVRKQRATRTAPRKIPTSPGPVNPNAIAWKDRLYDDTLPPPTNLRDLVESGQMSVTSLDRTIPAVQALGGVTPINAATATVDLPPPPATEVLSNGVIYNERLYNAKKRKVTRIEDGLLFDADKAADEGKFELAEALRDLENRTRRDKVDQTGEVVLRKKAGANPVARKKAWDKAFALIEDNEQAADFVRLTQDYLDAYDVEIEANDPLPEGVPF